MKSYLIIELYDADGTTKAGKHATTLPINENVIDYKLSTLRKIQEL
ncbi:MAG: hypothetical protein MUO34_14285 [Ignavibacteriaceae bacterium]|nr:hypothetical protein [Ignavibacteriaceae bacterium]